MAIQILQGDQSKKPIIPHFPEIPSTALIAKRFSPTPFSFIAGEVTQRLN